MPFLWVQILGDKIGDAINPLTGATVTYAGQTLITDATGRAKFENVANGTYILTASYPGYADTVMPWPLLDGDEGGQITLGHVAQTQDPTAGDYRGVVIYYSLISHTYYFTINGQTQGGYPSVDVAMSDIDVILGPVSGGDGSNPPPSGSNLTLAETYRTVPIYVDSTTGLFYLTLGTATYPDVASLAYAHNLIDNYATTHSEIPPVPPVGVTPDAIYSGELTTQQGNAGSLNGDPQKASILSNGVQSLINGIGLTREALANVRDAEDPEAAAADLIIQVSELSLGALAGLEIVGVVAELVSLGQIETIMSAINEILDATGITETMRKIFAMVIDRQLLTPAEHYLNSVYTPEHPSEGQLTDYMFKGLISPDQFRGELARKGLKAAYADMAMWAHYSRPNLSELVDGVNRGIITEDQAARMLARLPVNFTAWDSGDVSDGDLLWALQKTPLAKADIRRAWLYKLLTHEDLVARYTSQGYREDASMEAAIQEQIAISPLQNACIVQAGGKYSDAVADINKATAAAAKVEYTTSDQAISDIASRVTSGELTDAEGVAAEAAVKAVLKQRLDAIYAQEGPGKDEAWALLLTDIQRCKSEQDPDNLVLLRFKLAGERKNVPTDFSIVTPDIPYEG